MAKNVTFSIVLVLFVVSATVKTEIQVNDVTANEVFIEFTNLAVYMMKRFVSAKTNTIVIIEKCELICSLEQKYHTAVLTKILYNLREEFAVQLFLGHYNNRPWDYNIFIVDSAEAFITLRYTFPISQHERFFNFFILLTGSASSKSEHYETLDKIFETCRNFRVKNVVVLNKSFEANHFSFYTYELSKTGNCRDKIIITEINRYENSNLKNEFLFPNHITNYNGCYINVSAHVVEPLLKFDGDINNETHLVESKRLSGVEGEILKLVAKALNFKIRLRFPREKNSIHLNSNSQGCFRDLEENRANIVIGAFSSTLQNNGKFSSSYVYHSTPYVFVVCSGLCFGPIKQLLNPFCPSTWTLLLIFFSSAVIFTKIIQTKPQLSEKIFGPKNHKPICSMFVIFFGNALPSNILPKKNFARFLLAAWLLLSFELRNGYQGKMFDSLRFSQRIPAPKTISQLLALDYTLLSSTYIDCYPRNKTTIMTNTTARLNVLQKSSLRFTSTALLNSLAHYNYLNWNTSTLTYVDEAIHMMQCVMYFNKNSIFRSSIDRILKLIDDAGITSHIAKQHVKSSFQDMNLYSRFEIRLSNNNLKGLYFVSSSMFLLATIVFVLELLTLKWIKLRKVIDALNSV